MSITLIIFISLSSIIFSTALAGVILYVKFRIAFLIPSQRYRARLGPEAPILQVDGFMFRDLNKNGKLDIYEDSRRNIEECVDDVLSIMTL